MTFAFVGAIVILMLLALSLLKDFEEEILETRV
jgi:hypothetical protein